LPAGSIISHLPSIWESGMVSVPIFPEAGFATTSLSSTAFGGIFSSMW
jgi:hypothetical protein